MIKTFELFNFSPDRDNIEKKKRSRLLHPLAALDKEFKFIDFEKDLLKSFGFVIVENNIMGYEKFHTKTLKFGNKLNDAKEIASSSIDKYRIIIWKYAPKEIEYTWTSYFYYLLDENDHVVLEDFGTFGSDYSKYDENFINKNRKEKLIDVLENITVELELLGVKIPEKPNNRSKIDPFNEENWD